MITSQLAGQSGSILPLQWDEFTIAKKDKNVMLQWVISGEINTGYFIIQQSPDAFIWKQAGLVNAIDENKYSAM